MLVQPRDFCLLMHCAASQRRLQSPAMSTKKREVIFGGRIMGAKIRAEHALELAKKAQRDADRAEAECDPPTRKHADLEAGGIAKMPLM